MVKCTLWEGFAQRMHSYLEANDAAVPVVIILQQCRLSKYLGIVFISLFFIKFLPEVPNIITSNWYGFNNSSIHIFIFCFRIHGFDNCILWDKNVYQ